MIQIARNIILTNTKMLNLPTTTAPQQRIITISIQVAQAIPHTALIPHKLRTIPREARFQEQGRIAQYLRNATITVWGNRTYCIHKVDHRSCSFSDIQHQSLAKQPPFKHRQSTNNGQGQGNKFIKEKILNLLVHTDSRCKTKLHDPIQAAARSSLGYAIYASANLQSTRVNNQICSTDQAQILSGELLLTPVQRAWGGPPCSHQRKPSHPRMQSTISMSLTDLHNLDNVNWRHTAAYFSTRGRKTGSLSRALSLGSWRRPSLSPLRSSLQK